MMPLPPMDRTANPKFDYPMLVKELVRKMSTVTTQQQKDEIRFFNDKLNVALGGLFTLVLSYGQSIEEVMFHGFGETSAVHDSGVAVWKNKLMNSRIRPTSVI